mgnify:CR=1 FL=1
MIKKFNYYFITLFIFGNLIEKYRGTWASLFTTLFLFSFIHILKISIVILLILFLIILFYAFYAIKSSLANFKNDDPQEIVIDEFIGQSIPICLYEIAHEGIKDTSQLLTFYFIMFILFRIFDIAKPYPVSYYDKNFKNSFGVIMDDVVAGLYVVAILVLYMVLST